MKKFLSKASILSFLVVLTFCDNNFFGTQLTRTSSLDPNEFERTPTNCTQNCDSSLDYFDTTVSWTQPEEAGLVSPEIVFVLDTSASMGDERDALIDALGGWLTNLESQGINNFCVDVMAAHYNTSLSGKLANRSGNPKCLCRDQFSVAQIVEKFEENISELSLAGGSGEAGLLSFHNSLMDDDILQENQAAGCYRNDMTLVPLFLADENDMGATVVSPSTLGCSGNVTPPGGTQVAMNSITFNNSVFPELDGQFNTSSVTNPKYVSNSCDEMRIRIEYYANSAGTGLSITPESVSEELITYNDSLPTYGSAIIYNTTTFPTAFGSESKGWGYSDFAEFLNADTANLATSSNQSQFNAQLNDIADALVDAVTFVRSFTLVNQNGQPVPVCEGQEDSLEIRVNGNVVPSSKYTLSANRKKVTFKPSYTGFTPGAAVSAEYISCE
jgi:hypothetical protein